MLAPEQFVPGMTGSITLAEAALIPLSLLAPQMQNRRILVRVFSELGLVLEVKSETSEFTVAVVPASDGVSATNVPKILVDSLGGLEMAVAPPLVEPMPEKKVSLVTPVRGPELPTVEALRAVVANLA